MMKFKYLVLLFLFSASVNADTEKPIPISKQMPIKPISALELYYKHVNGLRPYFCSRPHRCYSDVGEEILDAIIRLHPIYADEMIQKHAFIFFIKSVVHKLDKDECVFSTVRRLRKRNASKDEISNGIDAVYKSWGWKNGYSRTEVSGGVSGCRLMVEEFKPFYNRLEYADSKRSGISNAKTLLAKILGIRYMKRGYYMKEDLMYDQSMYDSHQKRRTNDDLRLAAMLDRNENLTNLAVKFKLNDNSHLYGKK